MCTLTARPPVPTCERLIDLTHAYMHTGRLLVSERVIIIASKRVIVMICEMVMDVYLHQISGGPFPPASCRGRQSCSLEAGTGCQAADLPLARGAPLTVTHSDCMRREYIENHF